MQKSVLKSDAQIAFLTTFNSLFQLPVSSPATYAVSEQSFSALKQEKMYLRATTGDSRLNHLIILEVHVHKDKPDATSLVDVANNFVGEKANMKHFFLTNFQQTVSP